MSCFFSIPIARSLGRWIACGACLVAAAGMGRAAGIVLPPIDLTLGGDFKILAGPDAPVLHWELSLQGVRDGKRQGTARVRGPGTAIDVAIAIDANGNGTWQITGGQIRLKDWLAGQLSAGTVTFSGKGSLAEMELTGDLTLNLRGVNLGELVNFADAEKKYVRRASGKVQGTIGLRLRANEVSPGPSVLMLEPGSVAQIEFVPSPGLFSAYVPAAILKQYTGIKPIEMGQTALESKALRLDYIPERDSQGRGAVLHVEGHPADPKLIAPLDIDFNFTGPLEVLIKKAMSSNLHYGSVSF